MWVSEERSTLWSRVSVSNMRLGRGSCDFNVKTLSVLNFWVMYCAHTNDKGMTELAAVARVGERRKPDPCCGAGTVILPPQMYIIPPLN